MQKVVNVLALASSVVSLAVVGTVGYVFVNRAAIVEDIKEKALESVMGGLGGGLPTGIAPELAPGTNDLVDPAPNQASTDAAPAPVQF